MRTLVLGDVHSNWLALSAVDESFDHCLVVGDLVDYGVDPVPCVDWVREHATACIRGNHDHAVAQRVTPRGGPGFRSLAAATRPLHWRLLDGDRLRFLGRLPVSERVELGGLAFHLVHASPRDPMDEYVGPDVETWRARLEDVDADVVCVGHTHVPYVLDLGDKRVLNPGSVGQPRDGDPRASYAIVEDGEITLHRVEYDVEAALRQVREAGVTGDALALAENVLRNGTAKPSE